LTPEERSSAANGTWMCNNHGTLIDRDYTTYPADQIREWKRDHEHRISEQVRLGLAADANAQKRMLQRMEAKIEASRVIHRSFVTELTFLQSVDGHSATSIAQPAEYTKVAAQVRRKIDEQLSAWRADVEWLIEALDALGRVSTATELANLLGDTASSLLVYSESVEQLSKTALNRGRRRQDLETSVEWRAAEDESRRLVRASVSIASFE